MPSRTALKYTIYFCIDKFVLRALLCHWCYLTQNCVQKCIIHDFRTKYVRKEVYVCLIFIVNQPIFFFTFLSLLKVFSVHASTQFLYVFFRVFKQIGKLILLYCMWITSKFINTAFVKISLFERSLLYEHIIIILFVFNDCSIVCRSIFRFPLKSKIV